MNSNQLYKTAVRAAFDDFIQVNKSLIKHFKDANPALFMGYLIGEEAYHEREGKLDQYGYFYCTIDKIEQKFGFSSKVQASLVNKLVEAKLITYHRKKKEGSENPSLFRHFKINHREVFNLVSGTGTPTEKPSSLLPSSLQPIEETLRSFADECRATYQTTNADEKIIKIALTHGLCPEIINQSIHEKYKNLKGKSVTAKYLLKAFIPNINEEENRSSVAVESMVSRLKVT